MIWATKNNQGHKSHVTELRSVVKGVGSYLPERILTNDELSKMVDTSDEWMVQRTGIRQRHIAAEGQFTSDPVAEAHELPHAALEGLLS